MKENQTARVFLREADIQKNITITGAEKPEIPAEMVEKWQRIVNIAAKIIKVPAGLIMKITKETIEVFVRSQSKENPYTIGASDELGHGLYCETVIGTDSQLIVPNAVQDSAWENNPDVKLGMISYCGLPIKWPDGEVFGTICVLDSKENSYTADFTELLKEFRDAIETDLELCVKKQELLILANRDTLTNTFNRRHIESILKEEFSRSKRYGNPLAIAITDLIAFKAINDNYGHNTGDVVLTAFANAVSERIRSTDIFGRWGGDEFLLICPNTDEQGITALLYDTREQIIGEIRRKVDNADFTIGTAQFRENDKDYKALVERADDKLYEKRAGMRT